MSPSAELACQERKARALNVADAAAKVFEGRKKYEAAKSRMASNTGSLYDALLRARQIERDAMRALREHIEHHECAR